MTHRQATPLQASQPGLATSQHWDASYYQGEQLTNALDSPNNYLFSLRICYIKHGGADSASSLNPSPQPRQIDGGGEKSYLTREYLFFPKILLGGKLQNIYSTMFTVTICSELIPQNILQLKLTRLVTFKYLLLSK